MDVGTRLIGKTREGDGDREGLDGGGAYDGGAVTVSYEFRHIFTG